MIPIGSKSEEIGRELHGRVSCVEAETCVTRGLLLPTRAIDPIRNAIVGRSACSERDKRMSECAKSLGANEKGITESKLVV